MKSQKAILVFLVFFLGLLAPAQAKRREKKLPSRAEILAQLLKRAKTYAKLYQERKFKDIYDMVNSKYRMRVSRAMYEDHITFPDETDKFFLVTVEMYDVMDDITLGKVIFKISTYGKDHIKGSKEESSPGELESEFLDTTDWVYESGDWYIVERFDK